jgi:metallo-beta-lactamase class B
MMTIRGLFRCLLAVAITAPLPTLAALESPEADTARPTPPDAVRVADDVEAYRVAPGVWRFVTWIDLPRYGRTPANGLLVTSGQEALLVNTGWTNEQAVRLAEWAERSLGAKVTVVVPTHAHADTIGGLAALHRRGVDSWGQEQTAGIARATGQEIPHHLFGRTKELRLGERVVKLAFHGAGHTPDNIVAWLPAERILFGGCLVKAGSASDLGNVEDARLADWPATIEAVIAAYPDPRLVIPGHGDPGGADLLTHTLQLARAARVPRR